MSYGRCPSHCEDNLPLLWWCSDNPTGVAGVSEQAAFLGISWGNLLPPPRPESFHSICTGAFSQESSLLPVLVLKPAVIPRSSAVHSALLKSLWGGMFWRHHPCVMHWEMLGGFPPAGLSPCRLLAPKCVPS